MNSITAPILLLFLLFTVSAFIRIDSLWGINHLFYLPAWQKAVFVAIGIAIFYAPVNRLLYRLYNRLASSRLFSEDKTKSSFFRVIKIASAIAVSGTILFTFRVVSLYHDTMQAVYLINRDLGIDEVYRSISNMQNKPLLLAVIYLIRKVFHFALGLSPDLSLVLYSILCGVIYVLILIRFANIVGEKPLERLFIFIILFTQAISYYFFGFVNYYSIIPVLILLYALYSYKYLSNKTSIFMPLILSIILILTHYGTAFILPSTMFLILFHYCSSSHRLFGLLRARPVIYAGLPLFGIFALVYAVIQAEVLPYAQFLKPALVPLFPENGGGETMTLISFSYLIHLFNILLLISPIGIILLTQSLKIDLYSSISADIVLFLVILAAGGMGYILLLMPQGLYAWDIFAWASITYVITGSLYFTKILNRKIITSYTAVVIVTHSILYFSSWLALNNNVCAASLKYFYSFPREVRNNQVAGILRILNEQQLVEKAADIVPVLRELESHASKLEDYISLSTVYGDLGNMQELSRIQTKSIEFFKERERKHLNTAEDYYRYLQLYNPDQKYSPNYRNMFEPLYIKMLQGAPNHPEYLYHYGNYLFKIRDFEKSRTIFIEIDSLYESSSTTIFNTFKSHHTIKMALFNLNYMIGDYEKGIKYLDEARQSEEIIDSNNSNDILYGALITCLQTGHWEEAAKFLEEIQKRGVLLKFNKDFLSESASANPDDYNLYLLRRACDMVNLDELSELLGLIAPDTYAQRYEMYFCFRKTHGKLMTSLVIHTAPQNDQTKYIINCILSIMNGDRLGFLETQLNLAEGGAQIDVNLEEYEYILSNWISPHLRKAALSERPDSLSLYASKMISCAPNQYHGYLLTGLIYKGTRNIKTANQYFDKAIAALPNSKLISDIDAAINEIRLLKE